MNMVEFVDKYMRDNGSKLQPFQRELLQRIESGEHVLVSGGRNHGKVNLKRAIEAYNK